MRRITHVLVAVSLALVGALGVTTPARAIIGGEADAGQHPYVGIIFTEEQHYCTATAIDPTKLVTAAHCLTDGVRQDFLVSFAEHPQVTQDGLPDPNASGLLHGTAVDIGPWCGHAGTCGPGLRGFADVDLAVVLMDQPLSLPGYAHLPSPSLVDSVTRDTALALVGYGVSSIEHGGGIPIFAGVAERRAVTAHRLPMDPVLSTEFLKYLSLIHI